MAESGLFRTGFRGFNKDDVLKYIDEQQTAAAERLERSEDQRKAAQIDAAAQKDRAEEALAEVSELRQTVESLQSQVEKLTALAQVYKRELLQLREQAAEGAATAVDTAALDAANAQIRELEDRCTVLTEKNARYAQIVGDVNRLIMEARVVSGSYLDIAQKKSGECLKMLDLFLDDMKLKTREAVQNADDHRRDGDAYVQTLLSDLQDLGHTLQSSEQ